MFIKVKTSKSGRPLFRLARWLGICLGLFLWGNSGNALTVLTNDTTTTPTPIIYLGTTPDSPNKCSCLNNSSNLTDGQFETTITVEADTGQMWTIIAVTGLHDINSPAPPEASIIITAGKTIPELDAMPGTYQLPVIHIDALGFDLTIENEFGEQLQISATCYYPNPSFEGLDDAICITSAPIDLQADVEGADGTGTFYLNDELTNTLNPYDLGEGMYTIEYDFDAGEAGLNDSTNPGCWTSIIEEVEVQDVPYVAVVDHITLAMNNSCEIEITPDLMLVGDYPCLDDFFVSVFDESGIPVGNTITHEHINQTLNVLIESEAGGYSGLGHLTPVDYRAPEIECLDTRNTADVPVSIQFLVDTLSLDDEQLNTSYSTCFQNDVADEGDMHYYDLRSFEVDQDDVYTFEFSGSFRHGAAFLYEGVSDLSSGACQHIIAVAKEREAGRGYFSEIDTLFTISIALKTDQNYSLLTTSYFAEQTGLYRWAVYGAKGGKVESVESIEGILKRELICSDLDTMLDNQNLLAFTGQPSISDNCMSTPLLSFEDQLLLNGECGITVLKREFTATDQSNNRVSCTQDILFRPPTVDDVILPSLSTIIECDELNQWDNNGNPHPGLTGYPLVQTALDVYTLSTDICNLAATYVDNPAVPICESGYKILRVWSIFDWCDPTTSLLHHQQIRVGDFTVPELECLAVDDNFDEVTDTLSFSTTPFDCTATFELPLPVVTDNCSSTSIYSEVITDIEVLVYNQWGLVIDTLIEQEVLAVVPEGAISREVGNIPLGSHRIRYTVSDACGNSSTLECPFIVEDKVAPTAICSDDITISIGGEGEVMIEADQLNDGSIDNCSFSHIEVRRLASGCTQANDWGNIIPLNCCDVNEVVIVEVKAIDAVGNINNCQLSIFVQDQLHPNCIPPVAAEMSCNDLPQGTDLNSLTDLRHLFGTPETIDNCNADWQEFAPIINLDDCGAGTVTRQFQAVDAYGNISTNPCFQEIQLTIENNYAIKFPRDISINCDQAMDFEPEIYIYACDLIAVNYEDVEFPASGNERFQLFRTYNIINWCEYDGVSDPLEVSRDENCNDEAGEADVWLNRLPDMAYIDTDEDVYNTIPYGGEKGYQCDGTTNPEGYWRAVPSVGYWQYMQVIKIYDNEAPELQFEIPEAVCTSDDPCAALIEIGVDILEGCTPNEIQASLLLENDMVQDITQNAIQSISNGKIEIADYFPIGIHHLRLVVNDGFDNETSILIPIEIIDCTVDEPLASNGLVFELSPVNEEIDIDNDGNLDLASLELFANDLLINDIFDCGEEVNYAINRIGSPVNLSQDKLIFTCEDTTEINVQIHVWDHAFNPYSIQLNGTLGGPNFAQSFAQFVIEDPSDFCNPVLTTAITGTIETMDGHPLPGVQLELTGGQEMISETNAVGDFTFEEVLLDEAYTIDPYFNEGPKNGISTFDLILVTKHILGVTPLDSPYKMIAADVDNSGSISILDLVLIRKMVLSIISEFPNNKSWRFIDANYEFPQSTDPWYETFPEQVHYDALSDEASAAHFVAIKVGDVNLDAYTGGFASEEADDRSNEAFTIIKRAKTSTREGYYELHFLSNELNAVQGFQFSLAIDSKKAIPEQVYYRLLQEEHISTMHLSQDLMTISWNKNNQSIAFNDTIVLFTLEVSATSAEEALESVSISSRLTKEEAYNNQDETLPVELMTLQRHNVASNFELYQNQPNPFRQSTLLPFDLPEAAWAELCIYDHLGRVVWTQANHFPKGRSQVILDNVGNWPVGIYYYSLRLNGQTIIKKMVKQ